jgi:hypothetical protein
MEKSKAGQQPDSGDDAHPLYTAANLLRLEQQVNRRMCSKAVDLAEKYLRNGEPISTFNRDFMNEMVKADPAKIRAMLMQETGMSVGLDTEATYAKAMRHHRQAGLGDFNRRLAAVEAATKKIMDLVFSGTCSLDDIARCRSLLADLDADP